MRGFFTTSAAERRISEPSRVWPQGWLCGMPSMKPFAGLKPSIPLIFLEVAWATGHFFLFYFWFGLGRWYHLVKVKEMNVFFGAGYQRHQVSFWYTNGHVFFQTFSLWFTPPQKLPPKTNEWLAGKSTMNESMYFLVEIREFCSQSC